LVRAEGIAWLDDVKHPRKKVGIAALFLCPAMPGTSSRDSPKQSATPICAPSKCPSTPQKLSPDALAIYICTDILMPVKPIEFLGDSLDRLREFPDDARRDVGYQLDRVQHGQQPDDFKPMPSIGKGVEEIRVRDDTGAYRVIYTARLADAVYVLHAFQKKTQATSKRDIDLAKQRFALLGRK
jgi:phage-related protein